MLHRNAGVQHVTDGQCWLLLQQLHLLNAAVQRCSHSTAYLEAVSDSCCFAVHDDTGELYDLNRLQGPANITPQQ
jgi:hypothetical protein